MTASALFAVMAGAAIGAPLRFGSERLMLALTAGRFPWGTLLANLVGCAVVGAVAAMARAGGLSDQWLLVLATGFCGALTTFSGFSAQVLELTREGGPRFDWRGLGYAVVTMVAGIGLTVLTFQVAASALA